MNDTPDTTLVLFTDPSKQARFQAWALLLERLPLRETLDALKGYSYPLAAREVLCQRYALTELELAGILRLHKRICPAGRRGRDGLDLLLDIADLRADLTKLSFDQLLTPACLWSLLLRYELRPVELSRVLDAHAEMLARP